MTSLLAVTAGAVDASVPIFAVTGKFYVPKHWSGQSLSRTRHLMIPHRTEESQPP